MSNEGIENETPETTQEGQSKQQSPDYSGQFQNISEQLKQMNEQFLQSQQQMITQLQPTPQTQESDEIDPYDPDSLKRYVSKVEQQALQKAQQTVQETLQRDNALKGTLARLGSEYPEINQDAETQKLVVSEHGRLPKNLQDTAEGYELAVARVASSKGLIPKSKRPAPKEDEFVASGSSGSGRRSQRQRNQEVSDAAKAWSQLLGRDTESDDYKKRMNEIVKNKRFNKYGA